MRNIAYTIFAVVVLSACGRNEKPSEPVVVASATTPMTFETTQLKKINPQVKLRLAGELMADQQVPIYAKVNSYVRSIRVDIGSPVSKGQVIMVLEAPEIQAQIAAARSKWKAQEAVFNATKATYQRILNASKTEGAISNDAIDQITAKKLADEAQLEVAKSAYREVKAMEDYLVIRAPFAGVVTDRSVDLGAYVGPSGKGSDKPLLLIQTNQKLRLALSVPEANAPYLTIGDTIHFTVKSLPQKKYFGRVSRKAGAFDSKLRSERIEVDITNMNRELKPLMVAEAVIPLQAKTPTFFVPKTAVVESNLGVYVIAVVDGKTKKVPVTKGRSLPDQVEVFGELNEGEVILVKGSEEMAEGMPIPVKPAK